MKQLRKELSEARPAPLYIFHGEEDFLQSHYLRELTKLIVPEGTESFNLHMVEEEEKLYDAACSMPFMSERKLIIARDIDPYKAGSKTAMEQLLTDLPTESCTIVFSYERKAYKPDARTKIHALLSEKARIVEFKAAANNELINWVKRRFDALGRVCDGAAAEYLLFYCGTSMRRLTNEIAKIAASAEGVVSEEQIRAAAVPTTDAVVYDLTDALTAGKYAKAVEILQKLLQAREEPVVLLGAIGRQLRGLYLARLCIDAGRDAKTVADGMGYRSLYPAQRIMSAARSCSTAWAADALKHCARADDELKTLPADRERSLELLITRLSQ